MPGMTDSLSTLNSFIRTILGVIVVSGLAVGGWWGYSTYSAGEREAEQRAAELADAQGQLQSTRQQLNQTKSQLDAATLDLERKEALLQTKDEEIAALNLDLQQKEQQIRRLDTSLRLLKVTHRVARFRAIDQEQDPQTQRPVSVIEFVELNDEGNPIGQPKVFRIKGDVVYIDNWVVKFADKYVEQADLDRSTSLVLFRRIFGEYQEPHEGFPLDQVGARPLAYARGGKPSELEEKIWSDFWNIANDRSLAEELGIRAAHGDAVSIKVQKGKAYRVMLRASDGLSIVPDTEAKTETVPSQPAT